MIDKEIIPKQWEIKKLGDVCEIYQGYGFPVVLQGKLTGGIKVFKVGDISQNVQAGNKYLEFSRNFIDENDLNKLKAKILPKNTIVFAKIGEALKLNRRAITKEPCIVDNNAIGLKSKRDFCLDLFLYYYLSVIRLEDYSRATTVPSVRKSDIEEILIPIPPLSEQLQIVTKIEELFSELDKGKQQLETVRLQLKSYRQAVLKWAFEGKFTNKYVTGGQLPEGWERVKVKDVCKRIIGGGTPSTSVLEFWKGNIPWISSADILGIRDIRPRKMITENAVENSATNILPKGGIIVVTRVGLGKLAIAPFDICFSQDNQGLILNETIIIQEYALLFLQKEVQNFKQHSRGTTINGVTKKQLSDLDLILPQISEQKQIVQEIESRLSVCDKMEEIITNCLRQSESLRQSILKQAFEGKLIKSDENFG